MGVVIIASKTGAHSTVDIYATKTLIEGLHPALVGLGTTITTNEDLPPKDVSASPGAPVVIAKKTIKLRKRHKAYRVEKKTPAMAKHPVKAPEFKYPMKPGWYYWLEPG